MLSQRLMLMLTMVSMDTHMLLDMLDMPMELTHMPMVLTTERDLLMLSQRLTPTTMDMPDLMPMAYPYAYGAYYGKRSADAEPEADAYYYGYARPYAYGLPICLWCLLRKEIC